MKAAATSTPALRCACTLLRKVSRAVARRYEAELGKAGVTATQMAILRALERQGPLILSRLAEELVLERTSLYRALRPLAERGLVVIEASDRRSKRVELTAAGRRRIAEALPHWRRAQKRFVEELGDAEWPELARRLDAVLDALAAGS
jgi:DNA-binding MarR family transcriptional regulator